MREQDEANAEPRSEGADGATSEGGPAPEPAPSAGAASTEVEALKAKVEESQARLRTVSKAYTDLQAEMDAFRARMENQGRQKAERQAFETVSAFLDPVQNLSRCLAAPGEDLKGLLSGLAMVQHQFMEALSKLGLQAIPGEGSNFDPRLHEALAVTPVTDAAQDGKVLVVHQAGYTVNGKVLQAAQVVIGKYEQAAEA